MYVRLHWKVLHTETVFSSLSRVTDLCHVFTNHGQNAISLLRRIEATRTYDQVLHHVGYQVESYGKFHVAERWLYDFNGTGNAIRFDSYSIDFQMPYFAGEVLSNSRYISQVQAWTNGTTPDIQDGQQINPRSGQPYTPIRLDPLYGQQVTEGYDSDKDIEESSAVGLDSLPPQHSLSAFTGTQGELAIRRLAQQGKPWALTVSFEHPRTS